MYLSEAAEVTGKCLCGAVAVFVELNETTFTACHCSMCRKWGGGPALTVDGGKNISFKGEDFITTYDSSPWAERGFCKRCGTHLFYRLKQGNYCNVPLGLLDGADHFKFQTEIFTDNKPACYEFANQTEKMTEAEVVAKFSGT